MARPTSSLHAQSYRCNPWIMNSVMFPQEERDPVLSSHLPTHPQSQLEPFAEQKEHGATSKMAIILTSDVLVYSLVTPHTEDTKWNTVRKKEKKYSHGGFSFKLKVQIRSQLFSRPLELTKRIPFCFQCFLLTNPPFQALS